MGAGGCKAGVEWMSGVGRAPAEPWRTGVGDATTVESSGRLGTTGRGLCAEGTVRNDNIVRRGLALYRPCQSGPFVGQKGRACGGVEAVETSK